MESILVSLAIVFFIANFHVLGALVEICIGDISAVSRATDLRFRHLGWIDAPHTQNFEINSRANSEVKKN
jgi:hypothetical protein